MIDLEIIIRSIGEPELAECIKSAEAQTIKAPIRLIENYSLVEATRKAISESIYKYLVFVGADVILYNFAIERLYEIIIKEKSPSVAGVLKDSFLGLIFGIRIIDTSYYKQIEIKNKIGWDRWAAAEIWKKWGLREYCLNDVLGTHHSEYTPESAFKKFLRSGQKYASFWEDDIQSFELLCKKWLDTKEDNALAAIVGFCYGMMINPVSPMQEKDQTFGIEEWKIFKNLIDWKKSDRLTR